MTETPGLVVIATLIWIGVWPVALLLALALPYIIRRNVPFVEVLKKQWKASLCIACIYLGSTLLGGRGILNPYMLAVFCQAVFGLAIAQGIPEFNNRLVLVAEDGTVFYFDIPARRFVPSLTEWVPTPTSTPTNTPLPTHPPYPPPPTRSYPLPTAPPHEPYEPYPTPEG